jgi:hypothetical protein
MKKIMGILSLAFALTVASADSAQAQTSSRKKGAVIGGAVGAGTGIIVSKKKGKGAIVGGAVGAGAGYLYGRDKKKGTLKKS